MSSAVILDWMDDIRKVAKKATNDWQDVVEADDMEQDIVVHILEAPGTMRDLQEMDRDTRYRTLHKIAQRIASKERDDYNTFSGKFLYSIGEVEDMLKDAFVDLGSILGAVWNVGAFIPGEDGTHSDPTFEAVANRIQRKAMAADFEAAVTKISRINTRYLEIFKRKYAREEILNSTDRSVLERALRELTTEMNHAHKRTHDHSTGLRTSISNSAAKAISKDAYDAEYTPSQIRDSHIEPEVWDE